MTIVEITDRKKYFEEEIADALLTTAEQGSAWTLLYPHYTVVIPEESIFKDFIAYPIPKGNLEFLNYLNQWLNIVKMSDFSKKEYEYWILGQDPKAKKPRWSIMHNVLGWKTSGR